MVKRVSSSEPRFEDYLERIAAVLGHEDRREPLRGYLVGLCLPGERKSIEPMAARVDPRHVQARHQSLHHFVSNAPWDEEAVLKVAREHVLEPKERHSVGVARQYCGVLGKQDNCQVAVTVTMANEAVSVPAAYRLYLPEVWTSDRWRRREAAIPEQVMFKTKWQIALDQIAALRKEGLPPTPVVADAGFGVVTAFRDALTEWGVPYVVGITSQTTAWRPGTQPARPPAYGGRGRPPTLVRRSQSRHPVSIRALAKALPDSAWQTITWRQGNRGAMRSRFACVRVRPAHRDQWRDRAREVEWLIIEWPRGEAAPTKSWLSTLPADTPPEQLVRLAKLRWRIERDYEELKQEVGLDHFEGRGWRGFHHHGALCIAAYAFLAAERARLSPPAPLAFLRPPSIPKGFKPRGAPGAA